MCCPGCNHEYDGDAPFMGTLGRLDWFRCRYCGMDFSVERK